MLTNTCIPSLQPTILAVQQLVDNIASEKSQVEKQLWNQIQPYENQARFIQINLMNLLREIENYTARVVLEELGLADANNHVESKEIWSLEEAAKYYGVSKRTFQNMVSRFRQEETPPSWLLLPTVQIKKTRVHAKKFKEWYAHSPRAKGKPKKQI